MNLLLVSQDRKLFDVHSEVRSRLAKFGEHFSAVHIVVYTLHSQSYKQESIAPNVHLYPTRSPHKVLHIPYALMLLVRHHRDFMPSVVSTQDPVETGITGLLYAKLKKVPLQIQDHINVFNPAYTKTRLSFKIRAFVAKWVMKRTDMLRCVTQESKEHLTTVLGVRAERAQVLPVYIDTQKLSEAQAQFSLKEKYSHFEKILLMPCRFVMEKNLSRALDIFSEVVKLLPKTGLVLLGEGPLKEQLQLQVRELSLSENVVFESWTNDMISHYKGSDVLLLTSTYESYARTLLEALACGIRAVSTQVGIAKELSEVGAPIQLIDADNNDEAVKAVVEALMSAAPAWQAPRESFSSYIERFKQGLSLPVRKQKLVYILPEASTKTHMKFNVEALESLAATTDIFLILEKGEVPEHLKQKMIIRKISSRHFVVRALELVWYVFGARTQGYYRCYVHYSFLAAIIASACFMKTFYWNCGMPWKYTRPLLREVFEQLAYKVVSHMVTGTKALAQEYSTTYKFPLSKTVVVPNWIDVELTRSKNAMTDTQSLRAKFGIPEEATVLLSVQRLSQRKGAHHLLSILESQHRNAHLIIAGEGPLKEELGRHAVEHKLAPRVHFTGAVSHDTILSYFAITDVFLLPSEEEGMAHALLDAMASGVASVVFDIASNKEMLPQEYREYAVEPYDVVEFSQKVKELSEDADKRAAFGRALLQKVTHYDKQVFLRVFREKIVGSV
jgi:glycosyltransferase involved in cell wall biosynthesis